MAESRAAYAAVTVEKMAVEGTVQSVIVEDDDRALDKVTLVLDDPHDSAREVFREGLRVQVDLGWGKEHAILFEGEIVSTKPVAQGAGVSRVNVQAYDLGYRLMKGPDTPPLGGMGKLSDIVRAVFTRAASGVEVGEIAPDPNPEFTEENPLRQGNDKDWQFLQKLAARYNCRAFVEYNAGASKFYFLPVRRLLQAKPQGTLKYCRGLSQLIEFSYERIASAAAAQRSATVEDPLSGEVKSLAAPEPPAAEPPAPSDKTRARLESIGPTRAREYESAMEVTASAPGKPSAQVRRGALTGLPSDPALAEALIQQDPTRVLGFLGRGEMVGNVLLRAKGRVTIEGIAPWAAGDWYVRQVRHVYTRAVQGQKDLSTYRTHFIVTR